jgi:3-hydroxyacyl-[acyl-carrier-protein] dehydratase
MEQEVIYDINQIQEIIPHRYPFLMIDKVIEFVDNERVVAIKNVTVNEPFFQGHFPGRPVMPGVMMVEAMAQAGAILARKSEDGVRPHLTIFLIGVNDCKFKKQVLPGDTLRIEMVSIKKKRPVWKMKGTVTVNGNLVATAEISAAEAS